MTLLFPFQSNLVEEYFEAHSSSQVLTSDRTLEKLKRAALDQVCGEEGVGECWRQGHREQSWHLMEPSAGPAVATPLQCRNAK